MLCKESYINSIIIIIINGYYYIPESCKNNKALFTDIHALKKPTDCEC